ncbi:MAG: sel1 repeat family protein [Verrucomicrobia bacterium]|nr:sel1 repeat family protein [Verrucomicrobiota bacterium]
MRKLSSTFRKSLLAIGVAGLCALICYAQRPNFPATKETALKGDAEAQSQLALMYASGQGTAVDFIEAAKWFRTAAEQGHSMAQHNLGGLYFSGQGVPQDYQEALKWYQKAAGQGFAPAQVFLGWMYSTGKGVQENYKEGVKWYQMAAAQGDKEAQYNLGLLYLNGENPMQDYIEAYKWINLSAAQGNTNAIKYRARLAISMTQEQILEAQRRASQFKPKAESRPGPAGGMPAGVGTPETSKQP